MFNIGDYVLNQKTGHMGKVIGYGHQVINDVYTTTIKVLVTHAESSAKRGFVAEDLFSAWNEWPRA
ncbi:MAG: hypothetical protein KME08_03375 [Aphanothece sp. CMT-3BRIN-NPC111]|jgi:hypothetical protein|nr:hypothetical protein [Aphanothece sp. CMT-3BRIN-NPC111]